MSDNITLPREVVEKALEALLQSGEQLTLEAITALRTHLAAPRPEPEPEPVAYFDLQKQVFYWAKPTMIDVPMTVALKPLPLYAAPPAAAPEPEPVRHPGYILGNHWLETAYERVCAGEAEDAILEDYELVREPRLRELRRDAERYWWLLNWLVKTGLLSRERCRIDSPASFGDWWILRKPHGVGASVIGYGKTEDAAIDAAMEDKT